MFPSRVCLWILLNIICFSLALGQLSPTVKGKANLLLPSSTATETPDFSAFLKNTQIIHVPGMDVEKDAFRKAKAEANNNYQLSNAENVNLENKTTAAAPTLSNNWQGNPFANSVPNDNHIAVSDSGIVVSVVNINIRAYVDQNMVNNPSIYNRTLQSFSALEIPGNSDIKYDPRVIWDPQARRFIIVYLVGSTSSTSLILIGFSKTANPIDGWNLYTITGNPNNDGNWTDYPTLGLTQEEAFITGNLFSNGGQAQYSGIWQIDKQAGYAGNSTLNFAFFKLPSGHFSPTPALHSPNLSGPKMYFVTSQSNPASTSTQIRLSLIDNTISNGGTFNTATLQSSTAYRLAADANQKGSLASNLNTNDCRIQSAILANGNIQFVMNTGGTSNRPSIYHGVIRDVNSAAPVCTGKVISDANVEIAFPCITYVGGDQNDNSSLISVLHSSESRFPGTSVMYLDNSYTPSALTTVKEGEGNMVFMSTPPERWGDYMGIVTDPRQYNVGFIGGSYGSQSNTTSTWIGKVSAPNGFPAQLNSVASETTGVLYPNPSSISRNTTVTYRLPITKLGYYSADIFDITGKHLHSLIKNRLNPGEALLAFQTDALLPGTYLIKVSLDGQPCFEQKLVLVP